MKMNTPYTCLYTYVSGEHSNKQKCDFFLIPVFDVRQVPHHYHPPFIFNALLLLPLTYTVTKINDRHDFLAKLVTTKSKEDLSYETVNILLVGVTICFIIFSILEMAFYYIYNYWVSFYLLYMYLLHRNNSYFLSL